MSAPDTRVHCCLCQTDHPVRDMIGMRVMECPQAPPGELFYFNTKYLPPCFCSLPWPKTLTVFKKRLF